MPLNCTRVAINFHSDKDLKRELEQTMSLEGFKPGEAGSLHRPRPLVDATPAASCPPPRWREGPGSPRRAQCSGGGQPSGDPPPLPQQPRFPQPSAPPPLAHPSRRQGLPSAEPQAGPHVAPAQGRRPSGPCGRAGGRRAAAAAPDARPEPAPPAPHSQLSLLAFVKNTQHHLWLHVIQYIYL